MPAVASQVRPYCVPQNRYQNNYMCPKAYKSRIIFFDVVTIFYRLVLCFIGVATVCPKRLDPFLIVRYYLKCVESRLLGPTLTNIIAETRESIYILIVLPYLLHRKKLVLV